MELPLSPEQLEAVFDSMDRESNGFLTPLEFNTVLGEYNLGLRLRWLKILFVVHLSHAGVMVACVQVSWWDLKTLLS